MTQTNSPDFVLELGSESDKMKPLPAKMREYMEYKAAFMRWKRVLDSH
jgi:Uma2 family endonuclease